MKHLKLILLALAALMLDLPGMAQNHQETSLEIHEYPKSDLAIVSILNRAGEKYRLQLSDVDGTPLNKAIKVSEDQVSVQKLLKFDHLADGTYVLSLFNKQQNHKKYFRIKNNKLFMQPLVKSTHEIMTYAFKEANRLFITRINFEGEETELKITNKDGDVFLDYNLPLEERYNGIFDISALPMGKYCVTISTQQSQYSYDFKK